MPTTDELRDNGEFFIWNLQKKGTGSIYNMHVVNTDASYNIQRDPGKFLQGVEKEKKRIIII